MGKRDMSRKENQRIALTKQLLQDGLLRLLESKELEKISVTELCRESGINRATFYNHYSSPQDLLTDLESRLVAELNDLLGNPETYDEILNQMESVCIFYQENARSILTLAKCHADADLADIFATLNQNYLNIRPAYRRLSTMDSGSAHLISTFLCTGCHHLIREWLIKDIQKSPREIAELLVTIVNKDFL